MSLTQAALARAAGLNIATVVDFERHRRAVAPPSVLAIAQALESAGLVLLPLTATHQDGVAKRLEITSREQT